MLTTDKKFWYKLGVDYDEVKKQEGDILKNLIAEFVRGKKQYIIHKVGSINALFEMGEDKLRQLLAEIYVEWLWNKKKSGISFEYDDKKILQNEIKTDKKEKMIVEEVGDYRIIWKIEQEIDVVADDKEWKTIGRKILKANPIILRITNNKFELRGNKQNLKFFREKFEKTGKIREIKPKKESKSVAESIQNFIKKECDDIEIIGIKILETNLPKKSKLVLSNEVDIFHDLKELEEKEIISIPSIVNIKEIHIRLKGLNKKVKLRIKHYENYFGFEIDDKNLTDEERRIIKTTIETYLNISFSKVYSYDTQADEKYIFDQILKGSWRVYDKYYEKLSEELKRVLQRIVVVTDIKKHRCKDCKYEFIEEECPKCGSKDFVIVSVPQLKIKENELYSLMYSLLSKFISKESHISNGKVEYNKIELKKYPKEKYFVLQLIRTEFSKGKETKAFISPRPIKFLVLPKYVRRPKRADEYLYPLIEIDLYNLLHLSKDNESLKKEFIRLIEDSLRSLDDRINTLSIGARNRLGNLDKIEKYTPKNFERDVFYLLKRMLPFTEKWGREGKREADGIIVLVTRDDNYFVISYDPKLTVKKKYYKLSSQESSKAVFYILDENENNEINSLTKNKGISAHLIISTKFDLKNIENFVKNIREWYNLIKKHKESKFNVPVLFLETNKLLKIYDIYKEVALLIKGHPEAHEEFEKTLIELFSTDEKYKIIDNRDLELLRERIISIKNRLRYKSPLIKRM